jgi:hypothetical protein
MHFRFAVLLVLALTTPTAAQPNYPFFEPVLPERATQVMAHHGMHTLSPENSLNALLACEGPSAWDL